MRLYIVLAARVIVQPQSAYIKKGWPTIDNHNHTRQESPYDGTSLAANVNARAASRLLFSTCFLTCIYNQPSVLCLEGIQSIRCPWPARPAHVTSPLRCAITIRERSAKSPTSMRVMFDIQCIYTLYIYKGCLQEMSGLREHIVRAIVRSIDLRCGSPSRLARASQLTG